LKTIEDVIREKKLEVKIFFESRKRIQEIKESYSIKLEKGRGTGRSETEEKAKKTVSQSQNNS